MIGIISAGAGLLAKGVGALFSGKHKAARKEAKEARKDAKAAAKEAESYAKTQAIKLETAKETSSANMDKIKAIFAKYWWVLAALVGVFVVYKFFFQHNSPTRAQSWSRRMHAAKRRKAPVRRKR